MKWVLWSLLAAASSSACAFTFADSEFETWTGPYSLHQTNGGNPGAYLRWEGNIGGFLESFTLHRPDFVYNPAVSGAISSLNVALDSFRAESGSPSMWSGIVIEQGGQRYGYTLAAPAGSYNWLHRDAQNLTSSDFVRLFGSGNPDFTANGGAMAIGIFVAYVSEGYPIAGGFDNFLVTTEPVPEPASVSGLICGLVALRRRLRGQRRVDHSLLT
jgi:hypothetical protein